MATIDLFADTDKHFSNLHSQYRSLRDSRGYRPARQLLRELQAHFIDPDGNFVEQFQTTGFDSRTLELYLFAMFRDSGFTIDRSHQRPDFMISRDGITVAVEAVTASPTSNLGIQQYMALPTHMDRQEREAYIKNGIPIRLGSPLYTKLQAKYWEEPHVAGKPFVIAIQDFHRPGSLLSSSVALTSYLFGQGQEWYHDADGKLVITEVPLDYHQNGVKRIPSGFFNLPNAENVSAVLFTNVGTIPKFLRMAHQGSYRDPDLKVMRWGNCYRHDSNAEHPAPFIYEVGARDGIRETWQQGSVLIKNPKAVYPLPVNWFGAGVEEELVEGKSVTHMIEPFIPYNSLTQIYVGTPRKKFNFHMHRVWTEFINSN